MAVKSLFNCLSNIKISWLIQRQGLKSWTGGVKYPSFTYYPRFPDEKDPPYEPSKLLMVQRIKPFKGNHYKLKKILVDLRLDGKLSDICIVKNIPEVIGRLYKIKHLVKITPIRTPDGVPTDPRCGFLKENGELAITKTLESGGEEDVRLVAAQEFLTRPTRLDSDTLIKQSREKWINPYL